jgi:hypothetical protein
MEFEYFSKSAENIQVSFKSDKNNVTLHADQYTFFFIISRSVLRMRNVSDKRFTEKQNTHSMSNNVFRKSCRLSDNVEKYCRAKLATDDSMAHANCMLDN